LNEVGRFAQSFLSVTDTSVREALTVKNSGQPVAYARGSEKMPDVSRVLPSRDREGVGAFADFFTSSSRSRFSNALPADYWFSRGGYFVYAARAGVVRGFQDQLRIVVDLNGN
jgi:hypothetical protein